MLPFEIYSRFELGDMIVLYLRQGDRLCLATLPAGMEDQIPEHLKSINDHVGCRSFCERLVKHPMSPATFEGMVQLHRQGDALAGHYLPGESMIENSTACGMKLVSQAKNGNCIESVFENGTLRARHTLTWCAGEDYFEVNTSVENIGAESCKIDFLASFMLGMLSPFAYDDEPDRYRIHRFESFWSAEGRHRDESVESLGLEHPWSIGFGRAVRFGQRSAFVVKGHFPTVVFEDRSAGVSWGAQLATIQPWQMEISRIGDYLNLAGGLADHEFSGWERTLQPGETFAGPAAILSVCRGDVDSVLSRITRWQEAHETHPLSAEADVPVVFNDYCTSWGSPTSDQLLRIAERLKGHGVKYLMCDAGWFRGERSEALSGIGDWRIKETRFPDFDGYVKKIYDMGMVPGFWFEFENCSCKQSTFGLEHPELSLMYHGKPYRAGSPNMPLDFRKQEVWNHLQTTVVDFVKQHRVGYVKIDYNFDLIGADNADGNTAEGLREHLDEVGKFYRHLCEENPELVLEVCASGGHRLSAGWMQLGNMSSFSDVHEDLAIPVIAAATARQIPLSKNQVWATLRTWDDDRRLCYSLAAGFIGRLCLSGDIDTLNDEQLKRVYEATAFYETIKPLIKYGESRVDLRLKTESWNHLKGAQLFRRENADMAMYVINTFEACDEEMTFTVPEGLKVDGVFGDADARVFQYGTKVLLQSMKPWSGLVIRMKK